MQYELLNMPDYSDRIRLRRQDEQLQIFDSIRGKWLVLTPEEWVRQNTIIYISDTLEAPMTRIANEVTIKLNDTTKRCDTVVWDKTGRPVMIVEYKAPTIAVTQEVFDQIVRYNMVLHADYIVVSNGLQHFCCRLDYTNNTYQFIPQIPDYNALIIGASEN